MPEVIRVHRLRESWLSRFATYAWTLTLPFLATVPFVWLGDADMRAGWIISGAMLSTVAFALLPVLISAGAFTATKTRRMPDVRLSEAGLHVDDELVHASELATAWRIDARRIEVLTRAGDEIIIQLESDEEADELARAIRELCTRDESYALSGGSVYLRLARQLFGSTVPLTMSALVAMATPWLAPVVVAGGIVGWALAKGERRVRFGADGVSIEGRFRERFVPYRDIASVQALNPPLGPHGVRLELKDGERLVLHGATTRVRARLLCAIVEEGMMMAASGDSAGAHVPRLARGEDEDDDALARKLRAVGKQGSYRGAAIDPETLMILMRNPAADPDQRIAAAFALRETERGRARIRVAAGVSAEPEVREALESLAVEDLEEPEARRLLRSLGR